MSDLPIRDAHLALGCARRMRLGMLAESVYKSVYKYVYKCVDNWVSASDAQNKYIQTYAH